MYNGAKLATELKMTTKKLIKYYSPIEEAINIYSHGIGIILGIIALFFLLIKAITQGNTWHIVSFSIYGVSVIILFVASTIYHASKQEVVRKKLKVFDHCAIYILIAGTYTPFCLVTLNGSVGWILFGIAWGLALVGILLKLFFTGKFEIISTLAYVFMGWIIVFAIDPLIENLSYAGLTWLLAGGISYTLGAILYAINKVKFNHAIFHVFVLIGSACHFVSVYYYVIK